MPDDATSKNHVLVDIDSVLSNAAHREGLIAEEGWDAFHAADIYDEPVHQDAQALRSTEAARMKIALVDIDSTLSDDSHRQSLISDEGWDAYHAALGMDRPIQSVADLINGLQGRYCVILLTARPYKWGLATLEWLAEHKINAEVLLMRADDDYRPAPQVKLDLIVGHLGTLQKVQEQVAFIIDDRDDILKLFASHGITTLQVQAGRPQDAAV